LSAADAGRPRRFGGACGLEGANYGNKSPPLANRDDSLRLELR